MRSPSLATSTPTNTTPTLYVALLEKIKPTVAKGWKWRYENGVAAQSEEFSLTVNDISQLAEQSLCKNQVQPTYVKQQVKNNDIYILMFYEFDEASTRRTQRIMLQRVPAGFILARIKESTNLYLDIICAGDRQRHFVTHSGAIMIEMATEYARSKKLEQVSLSSLPPVLTYYPRFDFKHRPSCSQPSDIGIPQVLKDRTKNRTLPTTLNEAYNDEDVLDYMSELQLKKYGTRYDKDCSTRGKSKAVVKKSMKDARCGDDGFKMRLCLKNNSPKSSQLFAQ